MTKKIIFLMDLPGPTHGMSNVNLAVMNEAIRQGLKPFVINTVPSYAVNFFRTKWWGLLKALHSIICVCKLLLVSVFKVKGILYRPINGGSGQIYDLIYVAIARLFQHKIYIHHHSFSYLNKKSRLFALVNTLAGKNATHVVLGNKMKTVLSDLYKINSHNISVISNLAYFDPVKTPNSEPETVFKIGHLANLCVEKGADTFIEVCRALHKNDLNFTADIAGPFSDEATEKLVLSAVNELPQLSYVGPLYSDEKQAFYTKLDCFVFPSKYANEAEPLVLFEAAIFGSLILGTQRGCMKEVIHSLDGESFKEDAFLVDNIVASITKAIDEASSNKTSRLTRSDNFKRQQIKARTVFENFLTEMGRYGISRS